MQRIQVVSVLLHYFLICLKIIWLPWQRPLENKVQIIHLHVKHFHMVKRLQKSVQYIRRYSTKYAEPQWLIRERSIESEQTTTLGMYRPTDHVR